MRYHVAEIETPDTPAHHLGEHMSGSIFTQDIQTPDCRREWNIVQDQPDGAAGVYVKVKVFTEWLLALGLLVATAPVVLLLSILVKATSPGPAFYSQTRLGLCGRTYRILKLRTMRHNCEVDTGAVWALRDDPRTTKVGQFLRLTHLDELPQLINVLRGEMSLIGPRPERPEIAAHIQLSLPEFHLRLQVRPGVTGLAQMRLPADSTLKGVHHKLAHDLYYVENLSPALDFRIAICTILHFLAEALAFVCKSLIGSSGRAAERGAERITFIEHEVESHIGAA